MGMTNAYDELMQDLKFIGKTTDNILWATLGGYEIPLKNYLNTMKTINYNSGYGSAEFDEDAIVMFDDGSWLERAEYDGSEWWVHKEVPARPRRTRYIAEESKDVNLAYAEDDYYDDEDEYWLDKLEDHWTSVLNL